MSSAQRTVGPGRRVALGAVAALLAAVGLGAFPTAATAAGTILFENDFADSTVNGIGTVTVPPPTAGTNAACLTARGNATVGPLLSCPGNIDWPGNGKLRLTNASANQIGGVFGQTSFPTSNGLDVTFNSYQWGGGAADGIGFVLVAVDPANPAPPAKLGPYGGSLGYAPAKGVSGLANGYLGVGLDVFGNYSFSANGFQGSGCTTHPNITNQFAGAAVVRGPGNGTVGYCGLTTTYTGAGASKINLRAPTRDASRVPVQVLINPTAASFTSDSGVSVDAGTYKVVVTPVSQATKTLTGPLPAAASNLYPSAGWLNANGIPKQMAFGFVGSTGSVTDTHEVDDVKVLTFNPVAQLGVATTSYSAPTSTPGDPVTYTAVARVLPGTDATSSVSVTQTVPVGVVPVGAYGTGWVCEPAVGRTITCTTSATSFPDNTTLPTITVVAIVTGASVNAAFVQANSQTGVTSASANPATVTSASAGTRPAAPTGLSLNPEIGPVTGGNTVIGSMSTSALPTAVFIGTVAELQAGTPVVLLPCTAGRAPGCFNIEGASGAIAPMPARASPATVRVTTVTLGVAGFATYVYAGSPAVPAKPTATAGISSTTLTWVAPVDNGSPITKYVVTPYLEGVAQTTRDVSAPATSTAFTGLAPGGKWTYTVAAVNAYGTSAPSAPSAIAVPYVLPGRPSILTATARDSAALLTWSTPSNGGNAITGYVVTPYLGLVAQATQTFGPTTTQTVTGLTPGLTYMFTVAAINAAGTGPASGNSLAVTPNESPSLDFPAPPAGQVGVAYSRLLTVSDGSSPFSWSVTTGSLPAGLTLNASTGLLSGTPTAAGSSTFTVRVADAGNESATKSVTLVIAAAPALAFTPAAGEVGVAYSQQPTLTGGTGPFSWAISTGSLPAGLTINATTGLVAGTPTAAGSFSFTVSVTDSFAQVATRTVNLVVVARPAFGPAAPPNGQVSIAYSTTFSVTGGTLPLTWSVSAGSLPPGLSLNPATGVLAGTPTVAGSSSFTVSVADANLVTATKAVTVVVASGPLVVVKTADASSTTAGSTVRYTITATNTGSSTATGVALSDPLSGVLDDATYNADATATTGTVTYTASTLGWSGSIAAGATVTIGYSVKVANPDLGNKVLANTVTSTTLGTNCAVGSTDARCSATVNVAGLTIVKTADVATTTPGSRVHFQIVVANTGPVPYPGAALTDSLAGVLDDAVYTADLTATTGTVGIIGSTLSWQGNLPVGGSATITYSVIVNDPDTGNRSLTGTVVSSSPGSPCPSVGPAPSCTATVTVLVPALVITNALSGSTTTPGATVPFTMTVTNTGQTPYTAASVALALGGALDDASYNGDATTTSGALGYNDGILTWTGNLATGAVVTISGSLTVDDPDLGNRVLSTVASSTAAGSTCPVGNPASACTATTTVLVPALTLTKSAGVSTTTPGAVVIYTVLATNTGQTAYTSAGFADSLAGVLDDATYNADAAATTGAVEYEGSTLTWAGNLAVAASVTLTYSVTVKQPATGNRSLVNAVVSTTPGNNCRSDSTDTRCASSVPVLLPGLTFTGSVDATSATPGQVVHYTRTVTNTGQTTYTSAVVLVDLRGLLDDSTYNNDATVTGGTQQINPNGTVAWTITLAPGQSVTSTMSVTVKDPDPADRVLRTVISSNVAGSTCPTGSANPECTTAVPVLVPGLTLTKTADRSTVTPGETVVYTVVVANSGETTYPAATFTDDLSGVLDHATYAVGDSTATRGTVTFTSPVLSWTGPLAPGQTATITYSATVLDPTPGDKLMVNTVASPSKGSNCPTAASDPRCSVAVMVLVPRLTLTKTASVTTTRAGGSVVYTVTVTNAGTTAYTGAAFSDSLAGVLDDAAYNADASATTGNVGFASPVLTWTGNLAVGATAVVTYSVTVGAGGGGDELLANTVTSTTRGNNCPVDSVDARCTTNVPVAALLIQQAYAETTTTPGSLLHLAASFTNTGKVPYTGITISSPSGDVVDDAIPTGDQVASSGNLVLSASAITWTGDIPVGGVVTVTGTLTVKDPDPANRIITGTLVTTAVGSNCGAASPDTRCTATILVLLPGLTLTKSASTNATVPGGTVGYTILVQNTGQTPYTGAVVSDTLVGVLDDAVYNANATATTGTVGFASPVLTWVGDLAPGATATITYSVTVRSPDTGDKTLANPVSSTAVGSTCPPAGGGEGCHTTVLVLTPGLTIVKTADRAAATLDTDVTYTVTVRNSGQTSYAAAEFADSLAAVLDDATYVPAATTATSGAVTYTGGTLGWSGALTPGSTATITYRVTVNSPATGDRAMTNTVTSASTGSNCAIGLGDSRCTASVAVTNSVSLTFATSADVAATTAGATVTYTVLATNSSTSSLSADFEVPLAGVLDDATYNGDVADTGGVAVVEGSLLSWAGTVAAGATVTVTYSVDVDAVATGDQVLAATLTSSLPLASNNCLADSVDPRCTTTTPVAALVIEQQYTEVSTTPGSLVHLSATFTNTGAMPYTGITITSPSAGALDDAVPTGDQVASSGNLVLGATAITWTGNIPVGGVVTLTGTLTVKNPDPGDRLITGTAESSALGNNCLPGGTDTRCTSTIAVLLPALTVTKTANTTSVQAGLPVGYTVTVHNTGQTAYPAATVTDDLTGILDDAGYAGGAAATRGSATVSGSLLTWTGELAVGETAVITYSVTTFGPDPGDKTMSNSAVSTDVGSTCPPASGAAACRTLVVVLTPALTITSSADTASSVPGAPVTYTVTATNTGQTPYSDAAFTVPMGGVLDDATLSAGPTATSGTASFTAPDLSWAGSLAPGVAATITYTVTVKTPPTGDFALRQTVRSSTIANTCPVGGTDPRCATTVLIASLVITSTTDVATTQPAAVVRHTVTIENKGTVPYSGAVVDVDFRGSIDDAVYNEDADTTAGSLAFDVPNGAVTWNGDLPVGAPVVTISGTLTVSNPVLGDKVMTTVASTTAIASNCPVGPPGAGCRTEVLVLTPALTITKVASRVAASPGDTVGYTITATNTGETAYPGAVITDALGGILNDASYNADAVASVGSVGSLEYAGSVLTWTGNLAIGGSVTITFTAQVHSPYGGDGMLYNRVASDEIGSTCPAGGTVPACAADVTVLVPALELTIVADRTTTVPGAVVGYTVVVRNSGETTHAAAAVTTSLAGVLDDAVYAGGATATSGAVAFTTPSLTWTGDLLPGSSATISFTVTVRDPDPGNLALVATVASAAPGSVCSAAGACTSTVTVLIPGLAVSTTADVATATPGDPVTLTITVSNTGQTPYVGTVVTTDLTSVLDDATLAGEATASTGAVSYTAPTLTWTGSLPVGAVATIRYTVTVNNPDTGNKNLAATVAATDQGSTCPSGSANSACTATVTVLIPGLRITKSAGSPTTTPGGVVSYTIVVVNTGQTAYAAARIDDPLSGVLPDSVFNADAVVVGGGTLTYASTILSWTGPLAIGATATITYSITIDDPDRGDKHLVNTVTSPTPGSTCPVGGTDPRCSVAVDVLVPALVVTKTADTGTVVAGSAVRFTITVANTGETPYAPAVVTDSLAAVLDDAQYDGNATADVGGVVFSTDTLVWTGPLALGQTATITYSVTARMPAPGNHSLTNTALSSAPGSNCRTAVDPRCTATVTVLVPALTISKAASTTEVVAGGVVSYTVTVTNTGAADYPAATLVDDLASVLDDATYHGGATASTGTVGYAGGKLTWVGALSIGARATLSYSVTTDVAAPEGAVLANTVVSTSVGSTCPAVGSPEACSTSTDVAARSIELSGLTSAFTLTGPPHTTVTAEGAVTMTVTTNVPAGYSVSVLAAGDTMVGLALGNTEVVPLDLLLVRETGTDLFLALSDTVSTVVHEQDTASGVDGDAVSNDYQLQVPNVLPDTYSTTLNYVVAAN